MKTKIPVIICSAIAMFLFTINCRAQDPAKVAGNVYKVLKDTMGMRALSVTMKPGEVSPMHSHPEHMAYVLEGGKVEMTEKGKQPIVFEMKTGDVIALPATTHSMKNVDDKTIKAIIFEKKGMTVNRIQTGKAVEKGKKGDMR